MAKRIISLAVSTMVALLSPGMGVYDALAQVVGQNVGAAAGAPLALPVSMAGAPLNGGSLIGLQGPSALQPGAALPSLRSVTPSSSLQLSPSPTLVKPAAAAQAASPAAATPAPAAIPVAIPLAAPVATPAQAASRLSGRKAAAIKAQPVSEARPSQVPTLDKATKNVADALSAFREVPIDSMEGSAAIAERLGQALTGEELAGRAPADAVPAPGSDDFGTLRRSGLGSSVGYAAKPAGRDSIETAARSYDGPLAQSRTAAFFSRLRATTASVLGTTLKSSLILLASGAAVLVSVPLFYSGSVLAGSLLLASGLAVAALPLLGRGTPTLVKPLPGVAFLGLGTALAWLSPTFGGIMTAALAGYGAFALIRHAFVDDKSPFYGGKALSAWLGGMGVLLGIGLLLTPAPALAAFWSGAIPVSALAAAQWVSLAAAGLLLFHMPDSVRSLMGRAFLPFAGALRGLLTRLGLMGSPTLRERLKGLWDRKLASSRWNALWLAPMWTPFLLGDALRWSFSSKGRSVIGRVAGFSLLTLGVGTLLAVPYFLVAFGGPAAAAFALAQTNAFWLGVAGTLGGWGLIHYSGPKGPTEAPWYETLGVAFATFAVFAGVGTAFLGLTGPAAMLLPAGAYLASPLLLRELPRWLGQGLLAAGQGFSYGIAKARAILAGVQSRSKFYQNLRTYARSEFGRTRYKAWLPIVMHLAGWPLRFAGEVLATALGLLWGLVQAPANFLWGALREARPDSALTRFVGAFSASAARRSIGAEGTAGRWLAAQLPALDETSASTRGPSGKAWLAFLQATLAQVGWLAGLVLWTPVALILALVDGVKAVIHPETRDLEDPQAVLR